MKILSVDISSSITGWAIFEDCALTDSGVFSLPGSGFCIVETFTDKTDKIPTNTCKIYGVSKKQIVDEAKNRWPGEVIKASRITKLRGQEMRIDKMKKLNAFLETLASGFGEGDIIAVEDQHFTKNADTLKTLVAFRSIVEMLGVRLNCRVFTEGARSWQAAMIGSGYKKLGLDSKDASILAANAYMESCNVKDIVTSADEADAINIGRFIIQKIAKET